MDEDGRFVTLTRAVEVAGLSEALNGTSDQSLPSITVFAPTDEAFSRVPRQALDELLVGFVWTLELGIFMQVKMLLLLNIQLLLNFRCFFLPSLLQL